MVAMATRLTPLSAIQEPMVHGIMLDRAAARWQHREDLELLGLGIESAQAVEASLLLPSDAVEHRDAIGLRLAAAGEGHSSSHRIGVVRPRPRLQWNQITSFASMAMRRGRVAALRSVIAWFYHRVGIDRELGPPG
jgi:hypothetical protein